VLTFDPEPWGGRKRANNKTFTAEVAKVAQRTPRVLFLCILRASLASSAVKLYFSVRTRSICQWLNM